MNKLDLKTGMRIVDRKNREYLVLKNVKTPYGQTGTIFVETHNIGWMDEFSYNDDLTAKGVMSDGFDIMKVYAWKNGEYLTGETIVGDTKEMDLIWEREEDKKEMTIGQIEKELGYSIKIVKEN